MSLCVEFNRLLLANIRILIPKYFGCSNSSKHSKIQNGQYANEILVLCFPGFQRNETETSVPSYRD